MSTSAGTLTLDGLTRKFAGASDRPAVDNVSLSVKPGELLGLVGASGSGKTTTLRMTAGYEAPDAGRVLLDDKDITALPPEKRGFGMVFQHYALFPHLTVGGNVGFGLEARGVAKAERAKRVAKALEQVGLSGAENRAVQSLSGGEQQRIALARAIVIEPPVLLLDEPLSNLDPTLREATRDELRAMLHRLGLTAIFVTHDQEDAFAIADRIAVLEKGRLLQLGTPEELYAKPANASVAAFIGKGTLLPATQADATHATITAAGQQLRIKALFVPPLSPSSPTSSSMGYVAVLRPESLAFASSADPAAFHGVVLTRRFVGGSAIYRVKLSDDTTLEVAAGLNEATEGERVGVRIAREPVTVVPA